MAETTSERPTRVVNVQGRDVTIRQLVDTQMLLMAREAKILTRTDIETDRKLEGLDRMFGILESAVVNSDDRAYLERLMEQGELDLRELMGFVTSFEPDQPAPVVKVRRGRAPVRR